jgi:translation initiation factor IF-3
MHTINENIKHSTLKVVHHVDGFLGVLNTKDALKKAHELKLDLILTNEKVDPPLATIQDYGKFLYNQKKNTKKQKPPSIKEIKFRPNTDDNDLKVKARQTQKFLESGNIVKIKVVMLGREQSYKDIALAKFNEFLNLIENYKIDIPQAVSGNTITIQIKGV